MAGENMSPTLMSGTAAEHLVCADLLLNGYKAFLAPQICSYDVVAEINGKLLRIQVKSVKTVRPNISVRRQTSKVYQWSIRKRNRMAYGNDEFDLLALVALDSRQIAYTAREATSTLACVCIRANGEKMGLRGQIGRTFAEYSLQAALAGNAPMSLKRGARIIS